jgi:hypothetical protein
MQFSSFSRSEAGLTITLYNEIPIENLGAINYYRDNATGLFSKKEFRWSFNNEYWSSWQALTQRAFSKNINTHSNYYLFLQIRYVLTAAGSGTVSTFAVTYTAGNLTSATPRILSEDIQHLDSSAVLIHDILQSYTVTNIIDASTLNGYPGSYYLDRSHHTGKQSIASITGLQTVLNNITIPSGYLKEACLGSTFFWDTSGYLEASGTGGGTIQGARNIDASGAGVYYETDVSTLLFSRIYQGFGILVDSSAGIISIQLDTSVFSGYDVISGGYDWTVPVGAKIIGGTW